MTEKADIVRVCKENMCNGCMACVEKCPVSAISVIDELDSYNAVINLERCIKCDQCVKVCPNNQAVEKKAPIAWHQGWALDEAVRKGSSSGGLAAAISRAFVCEGGVVCSCAFVHGKFVFDFACSQEEITKFTGSKYVKSDPEGIYKRIRKYLNNKIKVLFIGLPCQVAGVRNFIGTQEGLFTIDLICHGTPSPKLLEMFLKESGRPLSTLRSVEFREKDKWFLKCDGQRIVPPTVMDRYMLTFLQSEDYTENCYSCQYAREERVSDITLGDAWGSDLSREEQEKGISLILCQTSKGRKLLELAELQLFDIDKNVAKASNKQLSHPSPKAPMRDGFFSHLKKHGNFKKAVAKINPKACFRSEIKTILIKCGIYRAK